MTSNSLKEETSSKDQASSHFALAVLLSAYILSFIDRNVLSLLVGPIRQDFDLSDFQFSLLHGLAFTLFYIVLGLPVGWLADRYSRKVIIAGGVFFWSIMTCACGFAKSFQSLFVARVGVGMGEATLSPAAYSMLSDLYSAKNLRWATSIFAMGITIGSGTSYMIGGWLFDTLSAMDLSNIPIINKFTVWQITFIGVGLPGLLVVLLLCFVKEPKRTQEVAALTNDPVPVSVVISFLRTHLKAYSTIMGAVSLMAIIGYGTLIWFPEFLLRTYGMSKTEAGSSLGIIFIFAGTAGTFAGAWFSGILQRKGYEDANIRLLMIVAAVLCIPATIAPLMPTSTLALGISGCVIFLHYTHFGIVMAGLQIITPNRMRAQVSALLLFMTNLFGLALGGTLVASMTDFVFEDDSALRYSLSAISFVAYPAASILAAVSLRHYRRLL